MLTPDDAAEDELGYFDLTEDELLELEERRFLAAHKTARRQKQRRPRNSPPPATDSAAAATRAAPEPRHSLSVRPTAAQLAQLHDRAAAAGYKSLARYLLERGLHPGRAIASPERPQLERLLFEVRKLNHQLAQMSRAFDHDADASANADIAILLGLTDEPGPLPAALAAQWQRTLAAAEQTLLTITEAFQR